MNLAVSSDLDHAPSQVRALDRIAAFYEHRGVKRESLSYLVVEMGGGNTYVLRSKTEAIRWLADQLTGISWKNRLGFVTLEAFSLFPRSLALMPMVRSERIDVAAENPFDVAVVRDRITLFQFRKRRAYKIALGDEEKLREEIERRERLPDSINTPSILESDSDYPYLIEERLDGQVLDDPVTEWDRLLEALTQLTDLSGTDRRPVETEAALEAIRERLGEADETIRAGFELLETLDLPATIHCGLVHGDLHAGNVFVDDSIYVLDWEDAREDHLIDDFFRPFVIHQHHEPIQRLFVQMIRNEGTGGEILTEYARTIGPTAYGESDPYSGLAVFYLLSLLAKTDENDPLCVPCREILSGVVSAFGELSPRSENTHRERPLSDDLKGKTWTRRSQRPSHETNRNRT